MGDRFYQLLLLAYPRAFRKTRGEEMLEVFRDCHRACRTQGGVKNRIHFWLATAWEAISNGLALRVHGDPAESTSQPAGLLEGVSHDVRIALRTHMRRPGFSGLAILILAAGLSACAVLFTLIDSILWHPLPYTHGPRIAVIWDRDLKREGSSTLRAAAPANFADWREQSHAFASMAAIRNGRTILQQGEVAEYLTATRVSADLLRVLGVNPAVGRWFQPEEDVTGRERVVVLSHDLWRLRFGSDPAITERAIRLDDQPFRVVGVMPKGFQFPPPMRLRGSLLIPGDLWMPLGKQTASSPRDGRTLRVFGLLAPGVTVAAADAEMHTIAERLRSQYPATNAESGTRVIALHEQLVAPVRTTLWILMAGIGLLLVLTCANLSSLLLGRVVARGREMATRMALGASRARLIRQVITENVLLALLSGALALVLARAALGALPQFLPPDFPQFGNLHLSPMTILFVTLVSMAAGVLFGAAPAFLVSRSDAGSPLAEDGRTSAGSRRQSRLRGAMISAQVAIAVTLLIAGALLGKSLLRLQSVDLGFDTDNLLVMQISVPPSAHPAPEALSQFYRQVEQQIRTLPGVKSASTSGHIPFGRIRSGWNIDVEGQPPAANRPLPSAGYHLVGPSFLATMGIALHRGRNFDLTDQPTTPLSAIVSASFAREHWSGRDAIGRRFRLGDAGGSYPWITVIGEIGAVRHHALDLSPGPDIYLCDCQRPARSVYLAVKTTGHAAAFASAVRGEVATLLKSAAIYSVTTMADMIGESTADRRITVLLLGCFAAAALLLACLGQYAVLSYLVAQRTREIGIRVAMGARRQDVILQVLGQGVRMALPGLAAGVLLGAGAGRMLSGFLYEMSPWDPWIFAAMPLLLLFVAVLAVLTPALRAAHLDPIRALRSE